MTKKRIVMVILLPCLLLSIFALFRIFPKRVIREDEMAIRRTFYFSGDNESVDSLTVIIPQRLCDYYKSSYSDRFIFISNGYVPVYYMKFITPEIFIPLANVLRDMCKENDDEEFVNKVLELVHQIPYKATDSKKYPIETLVDNQGDCETFSCLAASIIKADGLNVILLYWSDKNKSRRDDTVHINIAVNLSKGTKDRSSCYYRVDNKPYYIAECASDYSRVGELLGFPINRKPSVITFDSKESPCLSQNCQKSNKLYGASNPYQHERFRFIGKLSLKLRNTACYKLLHQLFLYKLLNVSPVQVITYSKKESS